MSHGQILCCNFLSSFIGLTGTFGSSLFGVSILVLCNITVIVSLHLLVEDLRLAAACLGDELVIQKLQDGVANLVEFTLNFGAVLLCKLGVVLVALGLLLLLHAGDDTPSSTTAANGILVGNKQEIALLD